MGIASRLVRRAAEKWSRLSHTTKSVFLVGAGTFLLITSVADPTLALFAAFGTGTMYYVYLVHRDRVRRAQGQREGEQERNHRNSINDRLTRFFNSNR
jgi:hypothetical protein